MLKKNCINNYFLRFLIIGGLAFFTHTYVAYIFLSSNIETELASLFGFIIAFIVSSFGHFFWSFKQSNGFLAFFRRFLLISVSIYIFNFLILFFLLRMNWFSGMLSIIISNIAVPAISYLLSRYWALRLN